jgi:Ras-related GTP-binding protein C/D
MSSAAPSILTPQTKPARHTDFFYPSSSTTLNTPSSSGASTTLSYHLITKHLALLALLPSTVYEERRGLVEYNVVFFRQGVQEICAEEEHARTGE